MYLKKVHFAKVYQAIDSKDKNMILLHLYMSIGNVVIGIILICIGTWFILKAFYLNHQVFFLGWAEQKWGPGGGTTAYKWIGLGAITLGMFCGIGIIDIYGTAFGNSSPNSDQNTTNKIKNQNNRPAYNGKNGDIAP